MEILLTGVSRRIADVRVDEHHLDIALRAFAAHAGGPFHDGPDMRADNVFLAAAVVANVAALERAVGAGRVVGQILQDALSSGMRRWLIDVFGFIDIDDPQWTEMLREHENRLFENSLRTAESAGSATSADAAT